MALDSAGTSLFVLGSMATASTVAGTALALQNKLRDIFLVKLTASTGTRSFIIIGRITLCLIAK